MVMFFVSLGFFLYQFGMNYHTVHIYGVLLHHLIPTVHSLRGGVIVRNRFDTLLQHISWIHQTIYLPQVMSHTEYHWVLVDSFMGIFNEYRFQMVSMSHLICLYKSISQWYGNLSNWINLDLRMNIVICLKPVNWGGIHDIYFVVSGAMIILQIVK